MVDKLGLRRTKHPTPYKVSWLQKGHQLLVDEKALVEFKIGIYKDSVVCGIIPMDVCHMLLGRPWQFDQNAIHDGRNNTYNFEKDGLAHTLFPLQETKEDNHSNSSKVMLIRRKEFLNGRDSKEVATTTKEVNLHFPQCCIGGNSVDLQVRQPTTCFDTNECEVEAAIGIMKDV